MHRHRLPDRRRAETRQVIHKGQTFAVSVGFFADGRPAECFISSVKTGSDFAAIANDAAVAASIALQYGVPLEALASAMSRDQQGHPGSVLGAILNAIVDEPPRSL